MPAAISCSAFVLRLLQLPEVAIAAKCRTGLLLIALEGQIKESVTSFQKRSASVSSLATCLRWEEQGLAVLPVELCISAVSAVVPCLPIPPAVPVTGVCSDWFYPSHPCSCCVWKPRLALLCLCIAQIAASVSRCSFTSETDLTFLDFESLKLGFWIVFMPSERASGLAMDWSGSQKTPGLYETVTAICLNLVFLQWTRPVNRHLSQVWRGCSGWGYLGCEALCCARSLVGPWVRCVLAGIWYVLQWGACLCVIRRYVMLSVRFL